MSGRRDRYELHDLVDVAAGVNGDDHRYRVRHPTALQKRRVGRVAVVDRSTPAVPRHSLGISIDSQEWESVLLEHLANDLPHPAVPDHDGMVFPATGHDCELGFELPALLELGCQARGE